MAAFTLTGLKVLYIAAPSIVTASEAITEGFPLTKEGYIVDPTDPTKLDVGGVAIQDAALAGIALYAREGDRITVTNTLTPHRTLIVKENGAVDYEENLASGEVHVILGFTEDANTILVRPYNSGKEKA